MATYYSEWMRRGLALQREQQADRERRTVRVPSRLMYARHRDLQSNVLYELHPDVYPTKRKSRIIDLKGLTFERLLVMERAEDYVSPSGQKAVMWYCYCLCGSQLNVRGASLRSGKTRSCGCLPNVV